MLIAYKNMLYSVENLSISQVYGLSYLSLGHLSVGDFAAYVKHDTLGHEYLSSARNFSPVVRDQYVKFFSTFQGCQYLQITWVDTLQSIMLYRIECL